MPLHQVFPVLRAQISLISILQEAHVLDSMVLLNHPIPDGSFVGRRIRPLRMETIALNRLVLRFGIHIDFFAELQRYD